MDKTEEINYLNIETIFDFGDFKYTPTEDMFQFYEKFKSMVHEFLKVQGNLLNLWAL